MKKYLKGIMKVKSFIVYVIKWYEDWRKYSDGMQADEQAFM